VAVQEDYGGGQFVVVVDNELQVSHGLVALVCQGGMLSTHRLLRVIHLVNHVGDVAQIQVQPCCVLQTSD
jgi:hypothetical protein